MNEQLFRALYSNLGIEIPRPSEYFKELRLIDLSLAQEFGISRAESPVFISPVITRVSECSNCQQTYTPLVYQTRRIIKAQHFCNYGGIYYNIRRSGFEPEEKNLYGWEATLVPDGEIQCSLSWGSARQVLVKEIRVHRFYGEELSEGFLIWQRSQHDLSPISAKGLEWCKEWRPELISSFGFRITPEGEVLFRRLKASELKL